MMAWGTMVNDAMQLTVIGAGAWGTTLAALASEHVSTTIWAREQAVADAIRDSHENTGLPARVLVAPAAVRHGRSQPLLSLLPMSSWSRCRRRTCGASWLRSSPSLDPHALVVSVTKGLEAGTGKPDDRGDQRDTGWS